ncbi:hypothetical protein BH24ACT20_BH24ACT20_10380 [soil metagenome]
MEYKEKRGQGLGFVLAVYAASRVFYLIAGAVLVQITPLSAFQSATSDEPFGTMNLWSHFDGEHYARLAAEGYLNPPNDISPAFFPLYPLLIRSFAALFGGPISPEVLAVWGVLISLIALPFALYFVYRIAEDGWGVRVAQGAVLALAFFPTTFYLNATYTESLFLALSAGAVWAARVRKDLFLACLLAGLATATRNVGLFLVVPLAYEWFRNVGYYRWWRGSYLALAPSGLVAYMGYQWWKFGSPFLFYTDQKDWNREATSPLVTISNAWQEARGGVKWLFDPQVSLAELKPDQLMTHLNLANDTYNLAFLILAVVLLIAGLRVLSPGMWGYAFLVSIFPAFFGAPGATLMGLSRYVLVAFPLFIVLGVLLRNRTILGVWLLASTVLSLLFCAMFVTWWYVA